VEESFPASRSSCPTLAASHSFCAVSSPISRYASASRAASSAPAGQTAPQRKEHQAHRPQLAIITIPARRSTTRAGVATPALSPRKPSAAPQPVSHGSGTAKLASGGGANEQIYLRPHQASRAAMQFCALLLHSGRLDARGSWPSPGWRRTPLPVLETVALD
jgi:hypothetical protein